MPSTDTITTYLRTVTVTSFIKSTNVITATATVFPKGCLAASTTSLNTTKSPSGTRPYVADHVETPKHSSRLAIPSNHGISSSFSRLFDDGTHMTRTGNHSLPGSRPQPVPKGPVIRESNDSSCGSEHTRIPSDPPREVTYLARVSGTSKFP